MTAGVDVLPLFAPVDIGIRAASKAALYVVIASGLSLIFGLMGVLNFAHGSLTMTGAYLGGAVMVGTVSAATGGVVRFALFVVAVAVVFAALTALGAGIELTLIRPIYDREPLFQILLTFGVVLVLDEVVRIVVTLGGLQPQTTWQAAVGTAPDFLAGRYEVLGVSTQWALYGFEALVGLLLVVGVFLFLNRTRYGLYIRAGSEDPEMTQALGIDVRRAFTVVFGVGAGLAGLAGVLLMWDPRFGASVPLGVETLLIAFIVVIIGGLGSFKGTVVAGLLVGFVDALMSWLFINVIDFPGLPELVLFAVLVTVLIVRPTGLFGVEEVGGH
jgi:branched-chain amino acid transport system permease protein